jgi:hypothetical protein
MSAEVPAQGRPAVVFINPERFEALVARIDPSIDRVATVVKDNLPRPITASVNGSITASFASTKQSVITSCAEESTNIFLPILDLTKEGVINISTVLAKESIEYSVDGVAETSKGGVKSIVMGSVDSVNTSYNSSLDSRKSSSECCIF